jgi:hypothetical protein
MKQNLPEHLLESMRQGLSDEEAISEGLAGLRHFLVKNSLKPIYSNGFTSI